MYTSNTWLKILISKWQTSSSDCSDTIHQTVLGTSQIVANMDAILSNFIMKLTILHLTDISFFTSAKWPFSRCCNECSYPLFTAWLWPWFHTGTAIQTYKVLKIVQALTHWGWDKMANIFKCIFFEWIFFTFPIKANWSLFLRVLLTITQHWFR